LISRPPYQPLAIIHCMRLDKTRILTTQRYPEQVHLTRRLIQLEVSQNAERRFKVEEGIFSPLRLSNLAFLKMYATYSGC
jgi:hypothetical protein